MSIHLVAMIMVATSMPKEIINDNTLNVLILITANLRHPREDFASVIYKDFEGHQIPVMKGYERYLRLIWGDYMQLPPVEQRVAKHDAVFADLHTPYKEYKGIHYAKKEAQP